MTPAACFLCGYPPEEHVSFPVPLSHPPQTRIICRDCFDDLLDLAGQAGWVEKEVE